jgi:hypothetical protein
VTYQSRPEGIQSRLSGFDGLLRTRRVAGCQSYFVEADKLVEAELDIVGWDVLVNLTSPLGAGNRYDVVALSEHQRDLALLHPTPA